MELFNFYKEMAFSRLTSSWSSSISGFQRFLQYINDAIQIKYFLQITFCNREWRILLKHKAMFHKQVWVSNSSVKGQLISLHNLKRCTYFLTNHSGIVSSYNLHLPSGRQMLINIDSKIDSTSTSHICQLLVTEWTPLITSQWPLSLPFNQDRTRTLELISWLYGEFKL